MKGDSVTLPHVKTWGRGYATKMKLYLVYEKVPEGLPHRILATAKEPKAKELLNDRRWIEEIEIPAEIRVPSPKGDFVVYENDPAYPGVSVDLITKSGTSLPLVVVESNPEEGNNIVTYVFGDALIDNYNHKIRLNHLEEFEAGEKK